MLCFSVLSGVTVSYPDVVLIGQGLSLIIGVTSAGSGDTGRADVDCRIFGSPLVNIAGIDPGDRLVSLGLSATQKVLLSANRFEQILASLFASRISKVIKEVVCY